MRKRKRIIIDYFFTIMILLCFFAFVASCFSLFVTLLGRIGVMSMSDSTIKAIANGSIAAMLTSIPLLVMFVALFKSKISEDRSTGDEFEQKYVSLMTDDTKARREFIELYRKKEGVT